MRSKNTQIVMVALAITLTFSGVVFGQESAALRVPPYTAMVFNIAEGQKANVKGIVVNRNADTFTVRDTRGMETIVRVTDKTKVKMVRKGWFHADRRSDANEIRRGLRLEAEGRGNNDGKLVARNISFDEQDLRIAEALESRVEPVENLANSTQTFAENNQQRIGQAEENAQRLSGQVEEVGSVANAATSAAKKAQSTADEAESDAMEAHERINALDDYKVFKIIAVHFKPGSARLTPRAKEELDVMAILVRENLQGWLVAVQGYADSTGRTERNRSLSERRANAVIDYLVTQVGFPPRRVVQPFGYGSSNPVAANNTREGRALNRRAEVRFMVNRGIYALGTSQAASQEQLPRQP